MHRTIGYLSKRFVQLRPGEERKVLLTFLYFFLVITAYYIIKPVSRSLVLGDLGSRRVPYVDFICAVVMGPIVTLFARLVDRLPKKRLVSLSLWAVIGVILLFWKLLIRQVAWVSGAFYIWVAVFSVLVVTLFWLVANDLYRPREAKRLFGFIGSGGILGGIVGSSLAAIGARLWGTQQLLLLSAGLLVLSWIVVQRLWRLAPIEHGELNTPRASREETFLSNPGEFINLLRQSRYLLLLVALVGVAKVVSTLVCYQFNPFLERTFATADERTAFTGVFFGCMNVVAFIIQFCFTGWILRRWGLRTALLALPVGVLMGTAGFLFFPMFALAAATELYDGSMNYSLQQTAKEVLYLPMDRSIRYKVKPFIDRVVFRFGKGSAALIGIILLDGMRVAPAVLSYVSVPFVLGWLAVATWLCREYVATIRTTLQARAAARHAHGRTEPLAVSPRTEEHRSQDSAELFGPLTHIQPSSAKLTLLHRVIATQGQEKLPLHTKDLLAALTAYEIPQAEAVKPGAEAMLLKTLINDPDLPMSTRCQAIRCLTRVGNQATVDYLFGLMLVEADVALRQEAVLGLVKLRLRRRLLEFPIRPIRRQIANEVENSRRIASVASIYRLHYRGRLSVDDPVLGLLRVLMEESVERVFRSLMLLYRPEDIHLIYEQMRTPDGYVRTDAVEMLDNLIDPAMRTTIFPILDEDRFLSLFEENAPSVKEPTTAYRVLQEAIWDHNCWFSVTTLCAVGRLRLTTMRQELERVSRHSTPLISTAAKVALSLAACPW